MNDIIKYNCKCGRNCDLVPNYAKYFLEFAKIGVGGKSLVCPNCSRRINVEKLYNDYLNSQESVQKAV